MSGAPDGAPYQRSSPSTFGDPTRPETHDLHYLVRGG
jgi:hypothetical protein